MTATPIDAPLVRATPSAIARATGSLTAPCSAISAGSTPRRFTFDSFEYVTTDSSSTAETPGTSVSRCEISPPVHDSATASVVFVPISVRATTSCSSPSM